MTENPWVSNPVSCCALGLISTYPYFYWKKNPTHAKATGKEKKKKKSPTYRNNSGSPSLSL